MTTDTINAPIHSQPTGQPYPERYVLVFTRHTTSISIDVNKYGDGHIYTLVYDNGLGSEPRYVARTYLRDQLGIHTDPRWPASVIAETVDEAMRALTDGAIVAVPVTVAGELLPDLTFAEDGRHPSLGCALVP